jgi:hypothetical protein
MRNVYNTVVGNSEEKRPLGRPQSKWEDNIKMDIRELLFRSVDYIHLA